MENLMPKDKLSIVIDSPKFYIDLQLRELMDKYIQYIASANWGDKDYLYVETKIKQYLYNMIHILGLILNHNIDAIQPLITQSSEILETFAKESKDDSYSTSAILKQLMIDYAQKVQALDSRTERDLGFAENPDSITGDGLKDFVGDNNEN